MSTTLNIGDWVLQLSPDSKPREIVVEVSTRCNLSCVHCFRWACERFEEKDMTLSDYRIVLNNAVESGVQRAVLTGWGEPTVNPYFLEMLSYAKTMGLEVVLNTNGASLLEYAEDLVEMGVDEVYVSVDAVDVDLYEKIRRLGDLSVVSKAISRLTELKRKRGSQKPIVKTIFTVSKLNLEQVPKLADYAAEVGIQEVYLSLYVHTPTGVSGVDCINEWACLDRFKKIMEDFAKKLVNSPVKVWVPNVNSYTFRECPFAANRALYVRVDGRVSPCMFLSRSWTVIIEGTKRYVREYVVGDALRESLLEVWRRLAKLYFKLYFNYMPSCLDCNLRGWCSYTLSTDADCWGNVPNCSFCPYHYRFTYCPL